MPVCQTKNSIPSVPRHGPSKSSPIFQWGAQVPERPGLTHCSHLPQQTSACLPASSPRSVTTGSSTGSIRQLGKVGRVLKMASGTFLSAQTGPMSLHPRHSHSATQHSNSLKAFILCQHPAPLPWSTGTLSLARCQPSTQPRNAPAAAAQLLLPLSVVPPGLPAVTAPQTRAATRHWPFHMGKQDV